MHFHPMKKKIHIAEFLKKEPKEEYYVLYLILSFCLSNHVVKPCS